MKAARIVGALLLVGVGVAGLVAGAVWDSYPYAEATDVSWAVSFTATLLIGLVLAVRLPSNAFGWLMMVGSTLAFWGVAADELQGSAVRDPAAVPLGENVFAVGTIAFLAAMMIFPDGTYLSRRWKVAHIVTLVVAILQPLLAPGAGDWVGLTVLIVLAAASMILRVVRGDEIVRRQVGFPTFVLFFGIAVVSLLALIPRRSEWVVILPMMLLIQIGFPAAIGVSILKYHLFEFDRIISRAIGYVLVVGLLGLVYVVGAVWAPTRLVGDEVPPVFVAGSTLLVLVLFNPVRKRLLGWVDRRFYRSRYDAERVAGEFSFRLRDEVDIDRLTGDWVGVVTETMRPTSIGVWVKT